MPFRALKAVKITEKAILPPKFGVFMEALYIPLKNELVKVQEDTFKKIYLYQIAVKPIFPLVCGLCRIL